MFFVSFCMLLFINIYSKICYTLRKTRIFLFHWNYVSRFSTFPPEKFYRDSNPKNSDNHHHQKAEHETRWPLPQRYRLQQVYPMGKRQEIGYSPHCPRHDIKGDCGPKQEYHGEIYCACDNPGRLRAGRQAWDSIYIYSLRSLIGVYRASCS